MCPGGSCSLMIIRGLFYAKTAFTFARTLLDTALARYRRVAHLWNQGTDGTFPRLRETGQICDGRTTRELPVCRRIFRNGPALLYVQISRMTIIKTPTSYFAFASSATTAATLSSIWFQPSNCPLFFALSMGSFPMWVSLVWPFPRSSKMVTSYAPSMASCSIPNCAGSTLFPFESEKYMEETIFSCRTISWYSTAFQHSCPSGVLMHTRHFPPTRKSI